MHLSFCKVIGADMWEFKHIGVKGHSRKAAEIRRFCSSLLLLISGSCTRNCAQMQLSFCGCRGGNHVFAKVTAY